MFSLRAIHHQIRGLLLIDGDNREIEDYDISTDGLIIVRWKRYEIENYLLVPDAIRRLLMPDPQDLFGQAASERAIEYLRTQLPESFFRNPLSDATEAAVEVPASKKLLPQMFAAAGRPMEKSDFFLIAEKMEPREIHPDVKGVLDKISELIPQGEHGVE